MGSGWVLSDLHLFSRRSGGEALLLGLEAELEQAEVLVLNGDTFDFRWSHLGSEQATLAAALELLRTLLARLPNTEVHYILGNHDCLATFRHRLEALAEDEPRLGVHEFWLRLDRSLFLHGDCANRRMDAAALIRSRRTWGRDRRRGRLGAALYGLADVSGASALFHRRYFKPKPTIRRVSFYLDHAVPGWRRQVDDCYFGHTHLPFRDHRLGGVRFHNTGSGIKGMGFEPMRFPIGTER